MSDPTTFIWLTLSGAIFIAVLIFVAGVLVGLGCGMRSSRQNHEWSAEQIAYSPSVPIR